MCCAPVLPNSAQKGAEEGKLGTRREYDAVVKEEQLSALSMASSRQINTEPPHHLCQGQASPQHQEWQRELHLRWGIRSSAPGTVPNPGRQWHAHMHGGACTRGLRLFRDK